MDSVIPSYRSESTWTLPSTGATAPIQAGTHDPSLENQDSNPLPSRADVVVVGGGIAGLSAAYHLLRNCPEMRVVILEANKVGHGASTRNSGMLTPGVGQSLAALVKRYGARQAREIYITSLEAVEYVAELSRTELPNIGLRINGQLVIARGPGGRRRLANQAKLMRELQLPCRSLNDAQLVRRMNVQLAAPAVGPAALLLPVAGILDPGQLVHGLADAVKRLGGTIIEDTKVSAITSAGVQLASGHAIDATQTVIATNGYDTSLNGQRGRLVPLHLRMIATRPLTEEQLDSIGWHSREGMIDSRRVFNYCRLTDDNRLLFGGGVPRYRWRSDVRDLNSDTHDTDRLVTEMRELFPTLSGVEVDRSWTGVIAYSLDTLPTVGNIANTKNVFHLDGWCGHGLALSVYFGRVVVDLIQGNPVENQPWFRERAPRVPTEFGRWLGIRMGAWATSLLDKVA